ncbi:MAG: HAD family hydrolase [Candidatus Aenigmatarchaeota archaeon]
MLDFFLNSKSIPATDYSAMLGGYPYMGYAKGGLLKGLVSDFDGVFERPDAKPLYIDTTVELGRENRTLGERIGDVWSILKHLITPADVPAVEAAIGKLYTYCGLTYGQYMEANRKAAEKFIRDSLVKGAKAYISKLGDEMGYVPAIVSGGYKPALGIVCNHLGIQAENVYATELGFHGHTVTAKLMVGERKPEAKDTFLKHKNSMLKMGIGAEYGCHFIIDDNPSELEAPFIKSGLNPSLITGNFERKELPFDVSAPCPEAREDMTRLIPPMYRYEYGWVAVNTTDAKTEHDMICSTLDVKEALARGPPYDSKTGIVSRANEVISTKEARGLVHDADGIRNMLARFLIFEGSESEQLARNIMEYFDNYIPETHAKTGMLSNLV